MNLYQIKTDKYESFSNEEGLYPSILLIHENKYTKEEFRKFINLAKFDMGHYQSFSSLVKHLEHYGFTEVITGYWDE